MQIYTLYSVKILHNNHIFDASVRIYREAVDFLITSCLEHWDELSQISGQPGRQRFVEKLIHCTAKSPSPVYDFDRQFYKFPAYMRRAAINKAMGIVSSYQSNLANWEAADPKIRGREPGIPKAGYIYPAMYRDNMYVRESDDTASIKVYIRNTWDWIKVRLRKSDAAYILRHCSTRKECVPTLRKRGKQWYLDFSFEEDVDLHETDIFNQTIVAADLGLNSACACSVMRSDGTILGRRFLRLPREYDSLKRKTDHIRKAQSHGSRRCHNLWKLADGVNKDIAVKTAQFIVDTAVLYNADTIVFEHLDLKGKKRGSRKMRLHLWKASTVQQIVTGKAHRLGMRISHICAWNTSRLAYDGSGKVLRGKESPKTDGNYSICEFTTGRIYNCDLNASYNIGARYFVREILKSLPVTEGQQAMAKDPSLAKRSTCTLSTLINLNELMWNFSSTA
ncbi:MAG: IS200/IS605 family accessory protein TnpB-related protein [Bilifractor sp.]